MNITVVGAGYVGLVTSVCLAQKGHMVTCVDFNDNKINLLKSGLSPIYEKDLENLINIKDNKSRLYYTTDYKKAYSESEVIFICVGTPSLSDGSADISAVIDVSKDIAMNVKNDCIIAIKSTVPIGTCELVEKLIIENLVYNVNVDVVSNPEFMAQGSAVQDMLQPSRIVIGADTDFSKEVMMNVYQSFNAPIVVISRKSAEMVKYASNDFLALKISYMNEIANVCDLVGADVKEVAKGMSYDERIGASFLDAGVGYGGSCLPKDTLALLNISSQVGYDFKTLKAAIDVNGDQKVSLYKKALERVKSFRNKKISILGVTFKPNTDDVRQSPAIESIEMLLNEGAYVQVYDPKGIDNLISELENRRNIDDFSNFQGFDSYIPTLKNADICFIFTAWEDVKNIKPEEFNELMNYPLVYDGRNIYNASQMYQLEIEYYAIGCNNK